MQDHLGWKDPLEKEMATYSSILAWKTPAVYLTGLSLSLSLKGNNNTQV